jgi:mannose/cellobiose epimerase-like protein (N-acyl-D-glucosamine 2-epimerase family)
MTNEAARLLDFARGAVHPLGGFGWLGEGGELLPERGVATWITARMTHCFALARILGDDDAGELVDHGIAALHGELRDPEHGGWHAAMAADGRPMGPKEAYAHAFVVLAAASATGSGHPDAPALLADALDVIERRFWNEDEGLVADVATTDWCDLDAYRGVNANMHTVEAFLAAVDVTGEQLWAHRALRILERVVHGFAREHDWRLPEHFDAAWRAQLDYNVDEPAHPFRPYGVTIGHLFEWARLCLHARTTLGEAAPAWLLEEARELYASAVHRGWGVDGADGFVYTTDFEDRPVVRERMHWVLAEAIAAAWVLCRDTGERHYLEDFRSWWRYAEAMFVDRELGSWRHELDAANRPSATVWKGKPDVYHAYQCVLLPLLPPAGSLVGAALKTL